LALPSASSASASSPAPLWSALACAAAASWIVVAASLRSSDLVIWPSFGLLVLALADLERSRWVRPGPLARLAGALAIPVFLFYLPTEIVYFHALRLAFGPPSGAAAWAELAGVFPAILIVAFLGRQLIERPARAAFRRLNWAKVRLAS
jgi:peptidoglycan/LPS O-acetylase OafA/YrhL